MCVSGNCPGWTDDQAATARKNVRNEDAGSNDHDLQKAFQRSLVFSIPEMAKCDYSDICGGNASREKILQGADLLQTELDLAESLQREWALADRLPKDYYNMKKIWHHMKRFGATNRAQVDTIRLVIQDLIRDLCIEIGKIDAKEQSFE